MTSFEIQHQLRKQEEMEKWIRTGIAVAQASPEATVTIHNFALAVVDAELPSGDKAKAGVLFLPSMRQIQFVMRSEIRRAFVAELMKGDEAAGAGAEDLVGG